MTHHKNVQIFEANDFIELIHHLNSVVDKFNNHSPWWRGHSDLSWDLLPSVYRPDHLGKEQTYFMYFKREARVRYSGCPNDDDLPGWFFLCNITDCRHAF